MCETHDGLWQRHYLCENSSKDAAALANLERLGPRRLESVYNAPNYPFNNPNRSNIIINIPFEKKKMVENRGPRSLRLSCSIPRARFGYDDPKVLGPNQDKEVI